MYLEKCNRYHCYENAMIAIQQFSYLSLTWLNR